jgi:FLVCR family MFS transporter 7
MIEEANNSSEYILYKSRWLFLATVTLLNMVCTMITVSFSPIATLATKYYKINGDELDISALTPWAINIVGMVVAIYCIGRFKLLLSIRYAATLTLIGGTIRVLSTVFSDDVIAWRTQFWLTYFGQVVISLGHPIALTMSTKVSQTWFGEKERAISTPILGLAPVLGGMMGQAISPAVMSDDPSNLPILNVVTASPLLITFLSSWLILRNAEPPSPPSRSAEKLLSEEPPTFKQLLINMKAVAFNRTALAIMICQGGGSGLMNTLLTQLNQVLILVLNTVQFCE